MLCKQATSDAEIERVSSLSREEAFDVSSFLHGRLRFRVRQDMSAGDPSARAIVPEVFVSDIVDVCDKNPDARAGALRAVCDRELAYVETGSRPERAVPYTADEANALVVHLNKLYGIP
jgi:hypothetical protein